MSSGPLDSLGREGEPLHLALRRVLQVGGETHEAQQLHRVPCEVDLPPLQSVPARGLEGVMVVVPALAEGEDPNDPVVHGVASGVPVLEAPHMAHRVDRPGDVPDPRNPEEESPHQEGEAAKGVEAGDWQGNGMQRVGPLQEAVEPLRGQVLGVALVSPHPRPLRIEEPACVRPPEAVERRVHVVLRLRACVVVPVRGDPIDGVALQRQGAAVGKQVLKKLGRLEGPVSQLAMVGQRDAKHARDEVAHEEAYKGLPGEVKGGRQRAEVHER
mmetsp:Transcript_18839/g.51181  ORF Transcript_18839/g.51181 Transcript_18839/m.51181 type:complete len:271 (-) Transcript_18839:250-1062(-)